MKTNDFIFKRVVLTFFVILFVSFFSCSTEEDGENLSDEPTEITFQIDLVKMYATDIKDGEGGRLEIAGVIRARISSNTDVTQETETLLYESANDPLHVTYDDVTLGSRGFFTVAPDYRDYSYFSMVGSMTEVDSSPSNPNEFMGDINVTIDLLTITETQEFILQFKESGGQHVEVVYTITRL
ncbi:hypothetical protein [uncultured Winogradskyella sp.]|uniref:hypothetical protein n=1 Tax=uncultured Winogradskyella sp. TaxID=395353 RepID=UPI002607D2C0|nr:hypothetical protein [uncultured Winogradskyella sp.]